MIGDSTHNQRHGPDMLTKVIGIFAGISWLLILSAIILYINSTPRKSSLYEMRFSIKSNYYGDPSLMLYVNLALALVTIVCFIGFIINLKRHKRKNDRFSKSLIFFGIGSIIWLVYNLFFI